MSCTGNGRRRCGPRPARPGASQGGGGRGRAGEARAPVPRRGGGRGRYVLREAYEAGHEAGERFEYRPGSARPARADVVAKRLPAEAVVALRRRLERLARRDPERSRLLADTAQLYDVSRATLYRQLREQGRPWRPAPADRGRPRVPCPTALRRYCEVIAALKLRTTNGKGRHPRPGAPSPCSRNTGSRPPTGTCERLPGCYGVPPSIAIFCAGVTTRSG